LLLLLSSIVLFLFQFSILGCRYSSPDYCLLTFILCHWHCLSFRRFFKLTIKAWTVVLISSCLVYRVFRVSSCFLPLHSLISISQAGPDLIRSFSKLISLIGALDKMQFLLFLVVLFSLSFNALSMPVAPGKHLQGRSFKVERAKRSDNFVHGPAALRKAYRKFGIDATTLKGVDVSDFKPFDTKKSTSGKSVKEDAVESDQTGSVTATSVDGDVEFISPISIGGQTMNVDFDTGSADM